MDDDDKKYKVDWTMHDCEWDIDLDDYVYTSPYNLTDTTYTTSSSITINSVPQDLFADWDNEVLRDKYPELMAAWEQYQILLEKYRMWETVTTPPEEPDF